MSTATSTTRSTSSTWNGAVKSGTTAAARIDRADATAVADAVVTLVTIDPDTRRARSLPEEFARLFPAGD